MDSLQGRLSGLFSLLTVNGNNTAIIENNAKLYKANTEDKIAVAKNEIEVEKQKGELLQHYYDKSVELTMSEKFLAQGQKEKTEIYEKQNELYKKLHSSITW